MVNTLCNSSASASATDNVNVSISAIIVSDTGTRTGDLKATVVEDVLLNCVSLAPGAGSHYVCAHLAFHRTTRPKDHSQGRQRMKMKKRRLRVLAPTEGMAQ